MTTLDLGELNVRLKADRTRLKRDLAEGEEDVRRSGDRMGRSVVQTALRWASEVVRNWRDSGHRAGNEFWRSADGRLRDARGRFVAAGSALGQAAGTAANGGVRMLSNGLNGLGSFAASAAGGLWTIIPALLAIVGAAAAAMVASQLLGGVLGAVPAIATGALAAVAALGIGFMGLGDAFKETAGSGGAMVDRARQIMLAERRVADANREVLMSQLALNRARAAAAERMEDLARAHATARLDEQDAVAAVAAAARDLELAQESGDPDLIDRATRAYRRAQLQLAEVRDRVGDLAREQAQANRAGVEGSDEVQAALERQRQAVNGVRDAHYELRQARTASSGGGGAAADVTELAASAAEAVAVIKGLRPAFHDLRMDVQERLFRGTGREIRLLADAWLPTLDTRLGSMAGTFNGVFRQWATTSRKPEFISNIASGWASVERMIGRIGKAVVGPGLDAFGRLSRAAGPMVDAIGDSVGDLVDDFARWIETAEKSGALDKFFKDAGDFFDATMDIGQDVASIIGSIVSILFKAEDRHAGTGIERFRDGVDKLARWFDDPANQQKIANFLGNVEDFIVWIKDEAIPTMRDWGDDLQEWADRLSEWGGKAERFKDRVVGAVNTVTGAVNGMPGRISGAARGMWDGLTGGFRAALNWIIRRWNDLSFTMPGITAFGQTIGGGRLDTPNIPELADGGLVKATPGGRIVNVAEAGEDEIVSPESQMRRIVSEELARIQSQQPAMSDPEIHVYIGDRELTDMVEVVVQKRDRSVRRAVTAGAGRQR